MRMVMAKIIEFYITQRFQKKVKYFPEFQRGKVIEFPLSMTRSTSRESASAVRHQQFDDINAFQLAYCAVAPLPIQDAERIECPESLRVPKGAVQVNLRDF
jgi:hypothetical protein